jgi:hypothetical protein
MIQVSTVAQVRTTDFWILRSVERDFRNVGTELTFCAGQNLIRVQISRVKIIASIRFKRFHYFKVCLYLLTCVYLFIYLFIYLLFIYLGHYDN